MVLPPSPPHDAPRPGAASWLDALKLALRLSRAGLLLLVDHARPEMLGALVRALLPEHPELEVYTEVHHVLEVPVGATLVLVPRPEDADWLNINRPVFAQRELRVVLFCDKATSIALARQAVDFFDWISHRVECPKDPPPFAVAGIRCALAARAPGIVWRGGDLESTFAAARPRRVLHQVSAAQPYQALVAEIRAHRRKWIAWTGVDSQFRLRRVRWALAEAGHRTRTILVQPADTPPDWWPVHAQVTRPGLARAQLDTTTPFPGRLAALIHLEPEAIALAETLLRSGTPWAELEAALLEAQDPGLVLGEKTYSPQTLRSQVSGGTVNPLNRRFLGKRLDHFIFARAADDAETSLRTRVFRKNTPWAYLSSRALDAGDIEVADAWAQDAVNANLPDADFILARVRYHQGRYSEAEHLLRQSLAIKEQALGKEHPSYGASLHALAGVLQSQGKYSEAEHLLRQSLAIDEQALGKEHFYYGLSLRSLASALAKQGKYAEAESLLRQSLSVVEQAQGEQHPRLCSILTTFGSMLAQQSRLQESESLLHRAVEIARSKLGEHHPETAEALALLALTQSRLEKPEAKALARQALEGLQQSLGPEHPTTQELKPRLLRIIQDGGK